MTELLKKAIKQAQTLPEDEQDRVARVMLDEIEAVTQNGEERDGQSAWEIVQDAFKDIPEKDWAEGLTEILTNDEHFTQEGFRALFRA